ncbi:MAG: hypothetical protein ACYTG1_02135 [Planctomycetota bacterium]|jgi:hypothetical protein
MGPWVVQADDLLRAATPAEHAVRRWPGLVLLVVTFGVLYGAVMGTFGGFAGERLLQVAYSAAKVPLLLGVTCAICVPSFFLLNTLFGLRDDFADALRAIVAAQAVLAVVLAALAPYTAVWYLSVADYPSAILFNGLMFGTASLTAQVALRRLYGPLVARNRRHRTLGRVWLLLYVFVGIQMGWVLRPFIGSPDAPTRFLREDPWSNAYVFLVRMVGQMLTGG